MSRKVVIGVVVALELAVFGAVLVAVVATWHRSGWTGLAYAAGADPDTTRPLGGGPFGGEPGAVLVVAPGSPAARAGLRSADTLTQVNGVSTADTHALELLAARLARGDTITYEFSRDGTAQSVAVVLESPYRSWQFTLGSCTTVLIAFCFLAISLLVAWSRPTSRSALVFFAMSSTGAAAYVLLAVTENRFPDTRGVTPTGVSLWIFGVLLASLLLTVGLSNLILHLALVFPRERPILRRQPHLVAWLHSLPFVPAATVLVWLGLKAAASHPWAAITAEVGTVALLAVAGVRVTRRVRRDGSLGAVLGAPATVLVASVLAGAHGLMLVRLIPVQHRTVFGVVFAIAFSLWLVAAIVIYGILTCVVLVRSYRESGAEERHQVRWPLWGTATAIVTSLALTLLSVVMVSLHPSGLGLTVSSTFSIANKLVYLLIPLSFAFAILKYRLLEIDILIRRTFVYGAMTTIVVGTYLAFVGIGGLTVVRIAGLQSQGVAVAATLLMAALLVPLRSRIQAWAERWLARHELDLGAALERVTSTARAARDGTAALRSAADEIQRAIAVRSLAVLMADGDRLRPVATIGVPERAARACEIAIDDVLLKAVPPVSDAADWPSGSNAAALLKSSGLVRLALAPRDRPRVALGVGARLSRQAFEPEDDAFLAAAAEELARAVARLDSRRTEAELGQAGEIQRALLPTTLPAVAGLDVAGRWRPAHEMSGDAYDAIRLDEYRVLLTIVDVVGKGLPAALLMSSVQTAVRSVATAGVDAAALVTKVREVVTANLTGGRFVTLCAAIVDTEAGVVQWCNAGHVPPLLVRQDGSVLRLESGGPAVARVFRNLPYHSGSLPLAAGDVVLMCTDGATEATDHSGEPLGDRRLEELAATARGRTAGALLDHVEAAVLDWANGRLDDDLTLVAAAFTAQAAQRDQ